ncbi:hypothetical protein [Allokutzneria oryzae]|uniref:hypothetical protein n=1 Tax=Allokutzneria oryzae TaxID=1378989 RepID=UPI003670ADAA
MAVLTPGALYLAVRQFAVLVLEWMAGANRMSAGSALLSWDGQWYLALAEHGYDGVGPGLVDAFHRRSAETPLAFFPGYPVLVRVLSELPGVGLVSGALAVSVVAGVVCSYGLVRLGQRISEQFGNRFTGRRLGLVLVVLFASSPMAVVLSMAYSEALFCALAVWALVMVVERHWLSAGVLCALAGLVRPSAAAVVAAVGVAAVIAIVRREDGWRPWAAAVIAPSGLAGYLAWVASRTGEWGGWFALQQRGWDSRFDGGAATLRFSVNALVSGRSVLEVATVVLLVAAIVLFALGVAQKLPVPLLVYAAVLMLMDYASNGLMSSKLRLLLPAFVLLVPIAVGLAKRRTGTVVGVLVAVASLSAWFGAYAITSWAYAI